MSKKPTAQEQLVIKTLQYLGKQLRLNSFRLRNATRDRKASQAHEAKVRRQIESLKAKVRREIDAHPNIVADYTGFEPEE